MYSVHVAQIEPAGESHSKVLLQSHPPTLAIQITVSNADILVGELDLTPHGWRVISAILRELSGDAGGKSGHKSIERQDQAGFL